MSTYEEEIDTIYRKLRCLEEAMTEFCYAVRWATDIETVTAAADTLLDSLKEPA